MALVLGLVAAYVIRQALHKEPVVEAPKPAPKVDPGIPVAFLRANTAKNTRLGPDDVFVAHVPKGSKAAAGDSFRSAERALGRITKTTLKAGMAIREKDLLEFGETLPDLADRLPEGHRAITIDIAGAMTGGKRLAEGDHIDITLTVEGTHPDLGEVTTKTLLKDVLVMDAIHDRPIQRGTRRANGLITEGITVAVVPEDANKLVVAERTGVLGAVLRSSKDGGMVDMDADAINRRELLGLKPIPAPKPQKTFRIEHYSGSKVSVQEFDGNRIRESRVGPSGKQFEDEADPQTTAAPADDKSAAHQSGVQVPAIVGVEDLN